MVAEAGTGREALDIARREICDVLLLDIAMPDQSGIDTLRTIRQGQPESAGADPVAAIRRSSTR